MTRRSTPDCCKVINSQRQTGFWPTLYLTVIHYYIISETKQGPNAGNSRVARSGTVLPNNRTYRATTRMSLLKCNILNCRIILITKTMSVVETSPDVTSRSVNDVDGCYECS